MDLVIATSRDGVNPLEMKALGLLQNCEKDDVLSLSH